MWSREESLESLAVRTGDPDTDSATALAETLGDLPLALEQAAQNTWDSMQISLVGYRRRLQSYAPTLFERERPHDYEYTIATTWSFGLRPTRSHQGCAALLFCCAFLAPEQIPRDLFASERIAEGIFAAADGELTLDTAIGRICPSRCSSRTRAP